VLSEPRILASKDFDSRQLLNIVVAGYARLPQRLRNAELMPLGSRINARGDTGVGLTTDPDTVALS